MARYGIEHWRKTRGGFFHRTGWLCLFVILFNLLAPVSWVAAHQTSFDSVTLCHAGPVEQPGNQPSHDDALTPHCPLCLIFAGAAVVPPGEQPTLMPILPVTPTSLVAMGDTVVSPLPPHWHPNPRGPPSLL